MSKNQNFDEIVDLGLEALGKDLVKAPQKDFVFEEYAVTPKEEVIEEAVEEVSEEITRKDVELALFDSILECEELEGEEIQEHTLQVNESDENIVSFKVVTESTDYSFEVPVKYQEMFIHLLENIKVVDEEALDFAIGYANSNEEAQDEILLADCEEEDTEDETEQN